DGLVVNGHDADPAVLGRAVDALARDHGGRSGDGESLCRQVDIWPAEVQQLAPAGSGIGGDVKVGTQPVVCCVVEEGPELGHGPDGAGFFRASVRALGPIYRVAADQLVYDYGVTEGLPQHRVQVGDGGDGQWFAVLAAAGQQVAVELGDCGGPHGLDVQMPDARRDVEAPAGPVVVQGARLDLHGVAVDPV